MNILAIGAHHDDIELGAGGTLAKFAKQGDKIFGLVLTDSETHYEIKNIHRTAKVAVEEAKKAAKIIGYTFLDQPGEFVTNVGGLKYTTEQMKFLEHIIHKNKVETLFCHWQNDMNTDHEAASKLSIVAGRHVKRVLMYRSNWYQPSQVFNGLIYSDISSTMNVKKKALLSYKSEVKNRGMDWINSFIDANHSYGFSINTKYAEVFAPVRYSI